MIENLPIKIDESGRIVIPAKIRRKFNIVPGSILYLQEKRGSLYFYKEKEVSKYKKLIYNLKFLEREYHFGIILTDENVVRYTSEKYKKLLNQKISNNLKERLKQESILKATKTKITTEFTLRTIHYYCVITIPEYTKFILFISCDSSEYEKKAYLACHLFK